MVAFALRYVARLQTDRQLGSQKANQRWVPPSRPLCTCTNDNTTQRTLTGIQPLLAGAGIFAAGRLVQRRAAPTKAPTSLALLHGAR